MKNSISTEPASAKIDAKIKQLADWRGQMLAKVREIIHQADPDIIEEWKWMGSPVWSHDGIIVVATVLKDKLKLTFSQGASLPDPDKVFNAGLGGNQWRAIDIFDDNLNERGLKNLVRHGLEFNQSKAKKEARAAGRAKIKKSKKG